VKRFLFKHKLLLAGAAAAGLAVALIYVQLSRAVPAVVVRQTLPADWAYSDSQLSLPWPAIGSAAVAVAGAGNVGATRDDRPRPIASLVKVMTAYVVLKDHPLQPGQTGPSVDVTAADADTYRQLLANGESVVEVRAGTQLTELDLLNGLLVPSGNNLAVILANWNSGSVEAFLQRMNEEAVALGMKDTKYADVSGASPASVSTAADQLKLAQAAMADPVFAAIVGQKQATLPVAGVVYNVNSLVGSDGVVGIKTGWTEEAGACFMFAVDWPVADRVARIFGVVLGQNTLADAFSASRALVSGVGPGLQVVPVVAKDSPVVTLSTAWGQNATATVADDLAVVLWPGMKVQAKLEETGRLAKVKAGEQVGKLLLVAGSQRLEAPVVAQGDILPAGLSWRLTRR
jgi:D-alanyl-D-alanine carboxypeptidase (penicillin-binding protein 5/6)